jgi:hypothetical protein
MNHSLLFSLLAGKFKGGDPVVLTWATFPTNKKHLSLVKETEQQ